MNMLSIYGIPNCDTIKKATKWLDGKKIEHTLHNYRKDGISRQKLEEWLKQQPLEKILNKASTTWKELSEKEKESAASPEGAITLMMAHPTAIKRPVIEDQKGKVLAVGFKEAEYEKIFR